MCGIIGLSGSKPAAPLLISTLEKLEYRGYDSSGIALASTDGIWLAKTEGKISALKQKTEQAPPPDFTTGIGHTRWATHGKADDRNAHPFLSSDKKFAVVHNGIIENHKSLKSFLKRRGFEFTSETDSETVAMLLEFFYNGDVLESIYRTVSAIEGSYALAIVTSYEPECVFAVRKNSSLVVGGSSSASYVCSDIPALCGIADNFCVPQDEFVARLCHGDITVFDKNGKARLPQFNKMTDCGAAADKGGFPYFMLKEIYSQPECIAAAAEPFFNGEILKTDLFGVEEVSKIKRVRLVGCGSAYHAGVAGKYFIEKLSKLPAEAELASEFRYRELLPDDGVLTVFISQSGETADTLFALRHAKALGTPTVAVVNTPASSIAREADKCIHTRAGTEIAVATTKGYTTQVVCLYLLALSLGKLRGVRTLPDSFYAGNVFKLPEAVRAVFRKESEIISLAERLSRSRSAFFIGRGQDYATALEGALKLKEISYVNANAYAAGELKHGTISLVESGTPVIAVATDSAVFSKTSSNIEEVAARGADVILITSEALNGPANEAWAKNTIFLPECGDLNSIPVSVALQLLAYHTAVKLKRDVDKPRNLAKSVTVE